MDEIYEKFKAFKAMEILPGQAFLFDWRDKSIKASSDQEARQLFSQYDHSGLVAFGDGEQWEWASHLADICPFVYRAKLR